MAYTQMRCRRWSLVQGLQLLLHSPFAGRRVVPSAVRRDEQDIGNGPPGSPRTS